MAKNKQKLTFMLSLLLCMLCACSNNEISPEMGEKVVSFRVTNFFQYEMDAPTRATPVSAKDSKIIKHLALGIFNEQTGKMVNELIIQNQGEDGFGSFTVKLHYGQYRLVFLGYGGNEACIMESPEHISFEDGYVPQTFLYTTKITIDAKSELQTNITLHRVVAGFKVVMEDVIPANASTVRFTTTGGGTVLNAVTGLAASKAGRNASVDIPKDYKGTSGKYAAMYLFLSENPETMDITTKVCDADDKVIKERSFTNVPLKMNTLTEYKGQFFDDQSYGFSISADDEWESNPQISY